MKQTKYFCQACFQIETFSHSKIKHEIGCGHVKSDKQYYDKKQKEVNNAYLNYLTNKKKKELNLYL